MRALRKTQNFDMCTGKPGDISAFRAIFRATRQPAKSAKCPQEHTPFKTV